MRGLFRWMTCCVALMSLSLLGCGKEESSSKPPATDGKSPPNKASANGGGEQPPKNGSSAKAEAAASAEPAFKLTADAWLGAWQKDAKAAKGKYGKKVIQVTGTVDAVVPDTHGQYGYVKVKGEDDKSFRCGTLDREPWWKVSPGSKVTIKGTAPADATQVGDLMDCVIVDAGTNPALSVAADKLTKEYLVNRSTAKGKYDENWLILEGTVAETKPANNQIIIKGEGPTRVICTFTANSIDKERMDAVKAGQSIKLVGQAFVPDNGNDINLKFCMMKAKAKK